MVFDVWMRTTCAVSALAFMATAAAAQGPESSVAGDGSGVADNLPLAPTIGVDGDAPASADDLSRELAHPNSPLATLNFEHTYTAFDGSLPGASSQSSNVTLFQPVFPFPLNEERTLNFSFRPGIAYVWDQPVFDAQSGGFDSLNGFSDIGYDIALGKSYESGLVVVGGMQGTVPLWTDVSSDQWRFGPEALVAYIGDQGFLAANPSHQWNAFGRDYQFSTSGLELFAGFYVPNAWTVFTDSQLTYDWVDDQATVPLNLTVRKVLKLGDVPVKAQLGLDYFVESNDRFGQDWAIMFEISPVVPNFIYNALVDR